MVKDRTFVVQRIQPVVAKELRSRGDALLKGYLGELGTPFTATSTAADRAEWSRSALGRVSARLRTSGAVQELKGASNG